MKQTFYSNGKLLITAEYTVLDGATALALPTKFGQNLIVETSNNKEIIWTSYDVDGTTWFKETILFSSIIAKEQFNSSNGVKNTLIEILHEGYKLNPNFIINSNGYIVSTTLTFSRFWGLGTSSTLINNIAQWLQVDAFTLLKNSFGGSGYDIACAQNNCPILYKLENQIPVVEKCLFNPIFKNNIYFVYLNKKQSSKDAIASYNKKKNLVTTIIEKIDQLTHTITTTQNIEEFTLALKMHEQEMSKIVEIPTVQELFFNDFNGVVKSLGAWGGDFVMVVSKINPIHYFENKQYKTIIPYTEMIL